MHRNVLFFGLVSVTALLGSVAACSSTTTTETTIDSGTPASESDAAANGKDTPTTENVATEDAADAATTITDAAGADADKASSTLSLAFASNCAGCHGATASGQGIYPSLPGKLTLDAFKATVRTGRRAMPAFSTSQISDADLAADYEWMKTKR
jgi:mono/diheme cytochrome c family protein